MKSSGDLPTGASTTYIRPLLCGFGCGYRSFLYCPSSRLFRVNSERTL